MHDYLQLGVLKPVWGVAPLGSCHHNLRVARMYSIKVGGADDRGPRNLVKGNENVRCTKSHQCDSQRTKYEMPVAYWATIPPWLNNPTAHFNTNRHNFKSRYNLQWVPVWRESNELQQAVILKVSRSSDMPHIYSPFNIISQDITTYNHMLHPLNTWCIYLNTKSASFLWAGVIRLSFLQSKLTRANTVCSSHPWGL